MWSTSRPHTATIALVRPRQGSATDTSELCAVARARPEPMRAAILGLLVAAVAGFLLWSYLKRFEDEASGGPRVEVLAVVRTLEPGSVLKDSDITERSIPQAYVEPRMIRS